MPGRQRFFVPTSILLNILFITLFFVPRVPPQQQQSDSSSLADNIDLYTPTTRTTPSPAPPPTTTPTPAAANTATPPPPLHGFLWPGRGNAFRVIYDFVQANNSPAPQSEISVTFTTHGTPEFLYPHVARVAERWQAPVAVAIYAPGWDASTAAFAIAALRECHEASEDVRQFVTFHLFFEEDHPPTEDFQIPIFPNCSEVESFLSSVESYRRTQNLTYPVNAARNIARVSAQTQYVLVADLELYPSVGIVTWFSEYITRYAPGPKSPPRVYVLPVFEVAENATSPRNKTELLRMMARNEAITFHKHVCAVCHKIPGEEQWLKLASSNRSELSVFRVTKRKKFWEPIFIGTNRDPLYDERLSWEGMSDKMAQMYEMCLLNYELHILDNAFLAHAPGIKRHSAHQKKWRVSFVLKQNELKKQILKEIHARYTPSKNCTF